MFLAVRKSRCAFSSCLTHLSCWTTALYSGSPWLMDSFRCGRLTFLYSHFSRRSVVQFKNSVDIFQIFFFFTSSCYRAEPAVCVKLAVDHRTSWVGRDPQGQSSPAPECLMSECLHFIWGRLKTSQVLSVSYVMWLLEEEITRRQIS